jgi:calcium-dependent secretion activator
MYVGLYLIIQAFTWFNTAMIDHTEVFWSLFAVDMDALIEMQPPDTWDSFPLFMLLNDYLRSNGNFSIHELCFQYSITFFNQRIALMLQVSLVFYCCIDNLCGGRFHCHLRDLFAPLVVRYVDLMESSIGQSIHNGFEKEIWKPQG